MGRHAAPDRASSGDRAFPDNHAFPDNTAEQTVDAPGRAELNGARPSNSVAWMQTGIACLLAASVAVLMISHYAGWGTLLPVDSMLRPAVGTVQRTLVGIWPIVAVAGTAQLLFPAVRRRPKILSYEMWLDVIYLLQTQLLYMTALGTAVGITTYWLQSKTPVLFPSVEEWPFWIQVVIAVWMYDFMVYWRHRLEHQLSWLWPMHAVHHTTRQVDVLTTTRLHFLEIMLGGVLNMWITARFGVSSGAAGAGFVLYLYYNYYVHTNVKIVHPGFLKYVFVSPFMHRWHHAREDQARDKNFGVVFAWNDWLFGTALHPDREPKAYGIDYPPGEVAHDSYLAHQLYPFQVLWVRLSRRVGTWRKRALAAASRST